MHLARQFGGDKYRDVSIRNRTASIAQASYGGRVWPSDLNADATLPLSDHSELFASTDWSYRSSQNFSLTSFLQPQFRAAGFWEGGVRAGYRIDKFEVALWSRNVADSTGFTSALNVNGLAYVFNAPRTYGAEASFRF